MLVILIAEPTGIRNAGGGRWKTRGAKPQAGRKNMVLILFYLFSGLLPNVDYRASNIYLKVRITSNAVPTKITKVTEILISLV